MRYELAERQLVAVRAPLASSPAARFMAALGAPAGEEGVRALPGKVDLFLVDSKSSY